MQTRVVTVFGGTGFLGRAIVGHLLARGFSVRIGSRHPKPDNDLSAAEQFRIRSIQVDVHDDGSVAAALAGADAAVNAVSLYVEHGRDTFRSVHVECARRIAAHAARAGLADVVHVSGIGSDPASGSPYIRSRGEGEAAVRDAFADAVIVRPAVMFGQGDAFLTPILGLLRRLPAYPMFGNGRTRLQPAFVEDVAEAVARILALTSRDRLLFECGGPRIYSYEELLRSLMREAGMKTLLLPVPFALWHALALGSEFLPHPPITRNQVELMRFDTIASPQRPGLRDLGIEPHALEEIVPRLLRAA